jgi:hypothetical protein
MLQELPSAGPGCQCRLRHSPSAPLCYPSHRTVLLFPAEDSLAVVVRRRSEGICSAADVEFQSLPVEVITAPTLRLDSPKDWERLTNSSRFSVGSLRRRR